MKNVLVINGPNLNMLGKRPKEHYGSKTLAEINIMMKREAKGALKLTFMQSNSEEKILNAIHKAVLKQNISAIVINPGALTHTSVALHDALEMFSGEKVEVHLSDVDNRDDFRKVNFVREVCTKSISGLHEMSYVEAIKYLKNTL